MVLFASIPISREPRTGRQGIGLAATVSRSKRQMGESLQGKVCSSTADNLVASSSSPSGFNSKATGVRGREFMMDSTPTMTK